MSDTGFSPADPAARAYPFYRDAHLMFRLIARGRPYICPFEPIVRWVPPGARLFDIGCGSGLWLMTLGTLNHIETGLGVDTNARALQIARQAAARLAKEEPRPTLTFHHTTTIADWPDEQFDVVSLIDVLHHIPPRNQNEFLDAAWRHVRPGGRLVYKDMGSAPKLHALANRLHDLILSRQLVHYISVDEVAEHLKASHGVILHQEAWRRGVYAHELLVVEKCK